MKKLLVVGCWLLACAAVAAGADVNVRDFGARGDGATKDTLALQRAVDAAAGKDGRVVVPSGTYLTGTLWLKSRTELHLEDGAVLLGSPDLNDYNANDAYPQNFCSPSEGWSGKHLILAVGQEHVAVTGRGVIDGNGASFLDSSACKPNPRAVAWRSGYVNLADCASMRRPGQELAFVECRDVRVEGVTLRNMAMWTCFFHGCDDVTVDGVTIRNDPCFATTDGLDIDACRSVRVTNCDIATSDDAIAIRGCTGRLADKMKACEDVLVSNVVVSSEAEGVRVGVGTGIVRRVRFQGLDIRRAGRGLLVQGSYMGAKHQGLSISDVTFSDVRIRDTVQPIVVTDGVTSRSPIENVRFERIDAEYEGYLSVVGGEGCRPRNIAFRDCRFKVRKGNYTPGADWEVGPVKSDMNAAICVERADGVTFENVTVAFDPQFGESRSRPLATCDAEVAGCLTAAAEPHYAFRAELETVHEADVRDCTLKPAADEFSFADGTAIAVPVDSDEVMLNAANDFADYLGTSMGVSARTKKGGDGTVEIKFDVSLNEREYKVEVEDDEVEIKAKDSRAAAQALYHLEDLMNLRRAPFLKRGKETRAALFSPRMAHSGWGMDLAPEKYLCRMAHAGFDSLIVYIGGIGETRGCSPFTDVNAIIRNAKAHGLDVWLYAHNVKAFVSPDAPGAQQVFDDTFGAIAKNYPEAKGLILVGESCQFPSKDERTCTDPYEVKEARGDKRPNPGWFPCRDYPDWLRCVKKAVGRHAPDMKVVFWTYNWAKDRSPDYPKARMELIDNIPHDEKTVLLSTFEMPEQFKLGNGLETRVSDYTLTCPGPGRNFAAEAMRAKANGMTLFTMCNTGGRTWDFGAVPYEPYPQLWAKRWDALKRAKDDWGLSGLMETHHYGWYPNFVSELAKEAYTSGGLPMEAHLRAIAARDFGAANADEVVAIWKDWSEKAANHPPTRGHQYGPFRIGPSYPFNFGGPHLGEGRKPGCDFPDAPYASSGVEICHLNFMEPLWGEPMYEVAKLEPEIRLLEPLAATYLEGAKKLAAMAGGLSGRQREKARRLALLAEYSGRTVMTAIHVKRGALAWEKGDKQAILPLARAEYANAKATLPLVDADSSLGFECSMEYTGGREAIEWKLRKMEELYGKEALTKPDVAAKEVAKDTLKIMSFNVAHCEGMDGKIDLARTAARIRAENPDFACLQEVDWRTARSQRVDQPGELARLTGMHYYFQRAIFYGGGQYGVVMLSREKPIKCEGFPLPGKEPRTLLVCEFKDLVVATTHLSVAGEEERTASVKVLRDVLSRYTKPVFLTGDFNATADSRVLAGLREFMVVKSDTDCQTFHGEEIKGPDGQPFDRTRFCIDYVMCDASHAPEFEVVDSHVVADRITSDHAPIVTTLAYRQPTVHKPVLVPVPTSVKPGEGHYRPALNGTPAAVVTKRITDTSLPKEGYRLTVAHDGIAVASSDEAGFFYALQTLRQMAEFSFGRLAYPCCTIEDAPRFGWRGLHQDVSRHFFGKDVIKRTLDVMAQHKLNVFHWHLTDDEGWRVPIAKYPKLTTVGAVRPVSKDPDLLADTVNTGHYGPFAYTRADIDEVVAHAKARQIRVVPEVDVPGHCEALLKAYPEYGCFAENPSAAPFGSVGNVICLGDDKVLSMVFDLFDGLAEMFPDEIVHVGGDEVNKVNYRACPKCQARMKKLGLKTENDLQAWFMGELAKHLAKRGRRLLGWDEIILDGQAPAGAIAMSWRGVKGGKKAAAAGHYAVMAPHNYCYLNYTQCLPNDPVTYPWYTYLLPIERLYSYEPLEGIPPEQHKYILGGQCCNWTEFTCSETEQQWKTWPRACALAEVFWSAVEKRDFKDFLSRMEVHRDRLMRSGVWCAPVK